MLSQPTLKEWMTPFPTCVSEDTSLAAARAIMREHGVHHLPVMHDHDIVGVLSLEALKTADARQHDDHSAPLTAGDVCQRNVVCVDLATRLDEVLALMPEHDELSVIVTRQGRMAGILTARDVLKATSALLKRHFFSDVPPERA